MGETVDDLAEAPGDDAAAEPETPQCADGGPGTGGEFEVLGDLVDDRCGQAGKGGDPLVQRLGEVDLAAHGCLGDSADLVLHAGVCGKHLDHLALDEGGVDIEHDQPLRATGETGAFHGDVDLEAGGQLGEPGPQSGVGLGTGVGGGDHEFESGHRVVGDSPDGVDVGALPCKFAAHRAQGPGADGAAEDHEGVCGHGRADTRLDTGLDLGVHADGRHGGLDLVLQRVGICGAGDEHPEGEPAADHDLLDVEQIDVVPGERREEHRGHAGMVRPRHSHQHRGVRRHLRLRSFVSRGTCPLIVAGERGAE